MSENALDHAADSSDRRGRATARSAPTPRSARAPAAAEVDARRLLLRRERQRHHLQRRIGKFCSIAAMTRINPGNHPMERASQSHFTYRASAYFPGESDEADFFAWRRAHQVTIGHDVWIGHGAIVLPGRHDRHRRGGRGRRDRHQGRPALRDRRRQSGASRPAALSRTRSPSGCRRWLVGLGARDAARARCPTSARCRSRHFSKSTKPCRERHEHP